MRWSLQSQWVNGENMLERSKENRDIWCLLKVYSSLRVFVFLKQCCPRSCVDTDFESVPNSAYLSHIWCGRMRKWNMGAGDKTGSLGRWCPCAFRDLFPLYQRFPPIELFIGEFILKGRILVMVHLLKTAFPLTWPYINSGLPNTLNKRYCHCQSEVTLDLSNLYWSRESATYNCWHFAKSFSGFRQSKLRY